jgi:lysophospholipase L1-like esterase
VHAANSIDSTPHQPYNHFTCRLSANQLNVPKEVFMKCTLLTVLMIATATIAEAQQPSTLDNNTRVMAMGDSITAGYGAVPVTNGYAYVLYRTGVYDAATNTTFANAAVPNSTSAHVLNLQVPSATQVFFPHVIVMTVGGNDLLSIFNVGADPVVVLQTFRMNLAAILGQLCAGLPETRIYIGNLYNIENFVVPTAPIIDAFNQIVGGVTSLVNAGVCSNRVKVADIHAAFERPQQGLLMFNRPGAHAAEPHPTNAGHQAIAQAFIDVK